MAARHQLRLPGLRRREPRAPARANRDLHEAEFRRALVRNEFRQIGDLSFLDLETRRIFKVVDVCRDRSRINRRATLARLLSLRASVYRELAKLTEWSSRMRPEQRQNRASESPPACQNRGLI